MVSTVVRLKTLDGTWEVGGADRDRGIYPENVKYGADNWGSSKASFDLKREPLVAWPDIRANTPVDIEVGGVLVWSGRISETPIPDATSINVQCDGWQAHLDDDAYRKMYVLTDMSPWQDARSFITSDLAVYVSSPQVSNAEGLITLSFPTGVWLKNVSAAGVVLDLGPEVKGKRVHVNYEWANSTGNTNMKFEGWYSNTSPTTGASNLWTTGLVTGPGTTTVTATTGGAVGARYFLLQLISLVGSDITAGPSADVYVRIRDIKIFGETSYESSTLSVLKASDVVSDAVDKATRSLSTDKSGISLTTFNVPELAMPQHQTPRDVISAVNAYHNYETRVDVRKRLIFGPRESTPALATGQWSDSEVQDASANSTEDVYSRVLVTGTNSANLIIVMDRRAGEVLTNPIVVPDIQFVNPSAQTDASGWTVSTGSVSRDTSVFHSSPASIKWTPSAAFLLTGDWIQAAFTGPGTFKKGVTYTFSLFAQLSSGIGSGALEIFDLGVPGVDTSSMQLNGADILGENPTRVHNIDIGFTWEQFGVVNVGGGSQVNISWTPNADYPSSSVFLRLTQTAPAGFASDQVNPMWIDSCTLYQNRPTILDRQGTTKTKVLPVEFSLTTASARQLADTFLKAHATTTFKGSSKVYGQQSVRAHVTGASVPVHMLPLYAGKLIRLDDRIDPDSGGVGRDARLAAVEVDLNELSATLTLDNSRANFEALLERLAVVVGQVTR